MRFVSLDVWKEISRSVLRVPVAKEVGAVFYGSCEAGRNRSRRDSLFRKWDFQSGSGFKIQQIEVGDAVRVAGKSLESLCFREGCCDAVGESVWLWTIRALGRLGYGSGQKSRRSW